MNNVDRGTNRDRQTLYCSIYNLDNRLLYILSEKIKNTFFDKFMPILSRINDYGGVYIVFSLLTILISKEKNTGLYIIVALMLGSLLGEGIIKHIIKRCRPINSYKHRFLIKIPPSYSFPSGHTTSSFAVLGVLWSVNSDYKYLVLILALLISFSRLYLHVHYPTDIIGGILLGLLCSKMTFVVVNRLPIIAVKIIGSTR